MRRRIGLLQIFNILGFIGMVIVNFLANYLPLNGKTTGEISQMYPNLFTPAAITFSIWGLIYFLLFCFTIYQSSGLFSRFKKSPEFVLKIGWWYFLSSLANIGWIFAWHYDQILLSLIIMLFLLFSLIQIYLRLDIGNNKYTGIKKYLVNIPFSIYLGWISIATIANATIYLVSINWGRFGLSEVFWTITMLVIGVLLTIFILFLRQDRTYALVIIWAYLGIILKRLSSQPQYDTIIAAAAVGIFILIIDIIYITYKIRKRSTIFYTF